MDDQPDAHDIWAVSDRDGPVVYFPVPTEADTPPADHVATMSRLAGRAGAPDGLIHGVWDRGRDRLAAGGLHAEIADPEVPTGRAAQRAATMARAADALAWVPEVFLAEPEPPAPRARRPAPVSSRSGTSRPAAPPRPRKRAATTRAAAPRKPAPPPEPEEKVCPSCFMMRRVDQFTEDGTCEFCA